MGCAEVGKHHQSPGPLSIDKILLSVDSKGGKQGNKKKKRKKKDREGGGNMPNKNRKRLQDFY